MDPRLSQWLAELDDADAELLEGIRRRDAPSVRPIVLTLHGVTIALLICFVAGIAFGSTVFAPFRALHGRLDRVADEYWGARLLGFLGGFALFMAAMYLFNRRPQRELKLCVRLHDRLEQERLPRPSLGLLPAVSWRQVLRKPWTALYVLACRTTALHFDDEAIVTSSRGDAKVLNRVDRWVAVALAVAGVAFVAMLLAIGGVDLSPGVGTVILKAALAVVVGAGDAFGIYVVMGTATWGGLALQKVRTRRLILHYLKILAEPPPREDPSEPPPMPGEGS